MIVARPDGTEQGKNCLEGLQINRVVSING